MSSDDAATNDAPAPQRTAAAWPQALLDVLAADPRVVGAADVSDAGCAGGSCRTGGVPILAVATTWDGRDVLAAELPRLGALALGAEPAVAHQDGARWAGMTADLRRAEIDLVRIGDLKPSGRGETAVAVLDPRGLVDQWVKWSRGRDRGREAPAPEWLRARGAQRLLDVEESVRQFERWPVGTMQIVSRGVEAPVRRPGVAQRLRRIRSGLAADVPVESALAARIDAALSAAPQPGAGYRVVPEPMSPEDALDAFLRIADGEGFLGDRVLFDAAAKRLAELSRRTPVFDEGFVLPTFDAVEARWRFGDGIGGCKTPLVPGVYVGVGVTPADHLEFWAAPFVREPMCTVACVADAGTRVVVERAAGKDAFFAALHGEVERAWDGLPDFVRTARRAGRSPAGDAETALRPLHLPRSYREAAKTVLGAHAAPSRLHVALALARAGSGEEPLNARKFGLAAGRMIALTPPGADDADTDAIAACGA